MVLECGHGFTDVSLWCMLKSDPGQFLEFDTNEFNQIRWFRIDEIPFEKADPHMKRFIQKLIDSGIEVNK